MVELTLVEAVRAALARAMADDDTVVVLGEDVGADGGVFRATDGLLDRFGPERVLDMPLSESRWRRADRPTGPRPDPAHVRVGRDPGPRRGRVRVRVGRGGSDHHDHASTTTASRDPTGRAFRPTTRPTSRPGRCMGAR